MIAMLADLLGGLHAGGHRRIRAGTPASLPVHGEVARGRRDAVKLV